MAEVEKKLDGIYALLSSKSPPTGEAPSLGSGSGSVTNDTPQDSPGGPTSNFMNIRMPDSDLLQQQCIGGEQQAPDPPHPDVVDQGIFTVEEVEQLIRVFRLEGLSFPFIQIPPDISVETMRKERPMLLLAVMAFALQRSPPLQDHMEACFREELSRRVIIRGEQSMDVLQGLIVYLAWYSSLGISSIVTVVNDSPKTYLGITIISDHFGNRCISYRNWPVLWLLILG